MTTTISNIARSLDASTVMKVLPNRPHLLALGEPTHGDEVLLEVRNALFRQLVEQEHYRIIAIESDCLAGLIVDDYVTGGPGTLDDVMDRGFSHGFGAFTGNRELVAWMRSYNEGRDASQHLRFAGFDGPLEISGAASPRQALMSLHDYLATGVDAGRLPCTAQTLDALLGDDDAWTNPAAMRDPSQSVGRTPEAERLRRITEELVALVDEQTPDLTSPSAREEWHRVRLYGRTASSMLQYHCAMADPSPSRLTSMVELRESVMAANLLALADQGPVLVNGHNGHLQRVRSTMRMGNQLLEWPSAGETLSAHLGREYALLATAVGTIRRHGVDVPPSNTLEGVLYTVPTERYVVDTRDLSPIISEAQLTPRVSPWYGYSPLDPAHLVSHDMIVFVRDGASS